jgi:hypothetical protein
MRATTIKLEGELLVGIEATKDRGQSVTDFVRQAVDSAIQKHRLREAATKYAQFLQDNPDELQMLQAWETAELSEAPRVLSVTQGKGRSRKA